MTRFLPGVSFKLGARARDIVALAAGLSMPLAFAPFGFFPIAVVSPAVLFYLWCDEVPARAAWRGFLFGAGMFGVGVSWVYVSMHNFGNMPMPLAALATAIFVVILSLYPALLGFLQARFFRREHAAHALLVLLPLWVLFEWWRSWFLSGFPWLNLGYSQTDTVLVGYAPIAGVYGVSLIVGFSAGLLVTALRYRRYAIQCVVGLAVLWLGGYALNRIDWAQPLGAPLRAALVQANVPLRDKWNPQKLPAILETYARLSATAPPVDLIVWPEAAIPAVLQRLNPRYLESLQEFSRVHHAQFMMGVIEYDLDARAYYNSVAAIGDGEDQFYRKQHLVPFGEYVPLRGFFSWIMRSFDIPMSELSVPTQAQHLLHIAGHDVGVSVCYEDAFGEEIIRALPSASFLANVSEDAWFGASLAPHQRLQMARMRSVEAARPMLRAANTGPSAMIDHRGNVLARSAQFEISVLRGEIQPVSGQTPYSRVGNWLVISAVMILLIFARLRFGRRKK